MMKTFVVSAFLVGITFSQPQGPMGFGGLFPSCADSCQPSGTDPSDYAAQCKNATAINEFNTCVASSSCDAADKSSAYQAVAQLCADTGSTVTAAPEATFTITSGDSTWQTNHPGAPGWSGGAGPFGGPGNGWGAGPWSGGASWTSGPWTGWWGTDGCPASTWSGWTNGPWSTSAPWTSWTACTATTTATSVITTTVTTSGKSSVITTTSFGVQIKEATSTGSASTSSSAASAIKLNTASSAVIVLGVIVGALLL